MAKDDAALRSALHCYRQDIWIVAGGADKGGVIVRQGEELNSEKEDLRLAYGAMVEKIEMVGERLHYRKLPKSMFRESKAEIIDTWDGPNEGWVSTKLKGKDLMVPMMPQFLYEPLPPSGEPPAMTFYAISDCHVESKPNMDWLSSLPKFERSTVLVAGDLGVRLQQIKDALTLFKAKFDNVFYCYGNHEMWVIKNKVEQDFHKYETSFEKLDVIRGICEELDVFTTPKLIENVWVVPVLGWYHKSWDTEPPLQVPPGKKLAKDLPDGEDIATDTMACKWGDFKNASEELAKELDKQNEKWGVWPLPAALEENLSEPKGSRKQFVISFSHFIPRLELMPEKRFLFQPNLTHVVGSNHVRKRVDSLQPDLHVFGHSHFPWDMTLEDGVRYRSWPLAMPDEQAGRIQAYPTQSTEEWHPLPVFDNLGRHYPAHESCWYSTMYTRIPREPCSCQMASFVKKAWCPSTTQVADSILSPGDLLKASTEDNARRLEKYEGRAAKYVSKEVKNAGKT
mmetsp:Transcript_96520/g.170949  ORF Transcript_96520/g.170949 Transcript_96520/m.170949 type:complete len:510 (+) Transcript_96520:68-1597(+)